MAAAWTARPKRPAADLDLRQVQGCGDLWLSRQSPSATSGPRDLLLWGVGPAPARRPGVTSLVTVTAGYPAGAGERDGVGGRDDSGDRELQARGLRGHRAGASGATGRAV